MVCCVLLMLAAASCFVSRVEPSFECVFPDFMQTDAKNGQKRDWRMHLEEGGRRPGKDSWELMLGFYHDEMRASVIGDAKDRPYPFTRKCLIKVSDDRFVVHHEDHASTGQKDLYMCVEFIQRSPNVVQIRESDSNNFSNPLLCMDKRMKINPWVIIDRASFFNTKVDCPLQGGYTMNVYDKLNNLDICSGYKGETRLESECMMGEGMFFRFRQEACLPEKLHMHIQQRVYCAANWEVKGDRTTFTFSLIRSDKSEHVWCFRFPTDNNGMFQSYLFRDARCEVEEFPKNTDRYFRISLMQDAPRSLLNLCMDDYEACSVWHSPCIHAGSFQQLTCAKLCGICAADRPSTCTLPSSLRGKWQEDHSNGVNQVELTDTHLHVEGYPGFRCIQWYPRAPRPYEQDTRDYEQMFVTTFENGCRPRYTCALFKKHSPSVLKYKLSQSEVWPWNGTTGVTVNCDPFRYHDDDEPFGSQYRSRHLKVFVAQEEEHFYVNCDIPNGFLTFHVMYQNGSECTGELTEGSSQRFHLIFNKCPNMVRRQSFGCLDSTKHGYLSKRIIVSELLGSDPKQIYCWLFPVSPSDTFFLLPSEECNEGARDHIASGHLQPLATFSFQVQPPSTTSKALIVEFDDIRSMGISHRKSDDVIKNGERVKGEGSYKVDDGLEEPKAPVVGESAESASSFAVPEFTVYVISMLISLRLIVS